MALDYLYFFVYLIITVFFALSIVYLAKYKRFQDSRIYESVNTYLFGLIFLSLYCLVNTLYYGLFIVDSLFPQYAVVYSAYTNYLVLISNLFIVSMIAICYLIAVILMKESDIQ